MTQKRKISARKILQAIVTLVLLCGCATAVLSTTKLQSNRAISGVNVKVVNEEYGFVDKDAIRTQLIEKDLKISETKLKEINIHKIENLLASNPWIAKAEVYLDNVKNVKVSVEQRVPVVRLFNKNGESYYLDSTAQIIPLSDEYVYYANTVTNVPVLKNDSLATVLNKQIVMISRHIEKDSFWNAQVSQIVVCDDGVFDLIPVVGKHKIRLGDTSRLIQKFKNLFSFYINVLNRVGWDKYDLLDVSYKGQLVGSPAIAWNVPVDKVRNKINWISSITGEAPKPIISKPTAKEVSVQNVEVPATIIKSSSKLSGEVDTVSVIVKESVEPVKEKKKEIKKVEPKYLYQGH